MERLTLDPVGIIHSEHHEPKRTPIQPVCAQGSPGRVEVFPQYAEALDDVEGFVRLGARGGWTEQVSGETFLHRGRRGPGAR